MVKIIGCTIHGNGYGDISVPQGVIIECLKCGHTDKTAKRLSGSISCPKCGSSDIQIKGEKE